MKLSDMQKEVSLAMADCDMVASEVARKIHCTRNNIDYHCARIFEITGLNPKCFYDLVELVEAIRSGD
jgi:sugar diacid utilization regulator